MKRIFQFSHCTLHLYRKKIILFSVLSIGSSLISLFNTLLSGRFIDFLASPNCVEWKPQLCYYCILFLATIMISFAISFALGRIREKLHTMVSYNINRQMLVHIQQIPFSKTFFLDSSRITQQLQTDSNEIASYCINVIQNVPVSSVRLITVSVITYQINKTVFGILLILAALYIVFFEIFKGKLYNTTREFKNEQALFFSKAQEQLRYIKFVKRHGLIDVFINRVDLAFQSLFKTAMHAQIFQYIFSGISCSCFASGDEFLRAGWREGYQVVFLDICMEGTNGIETARRLRAADPDLLIVFVTSSPEYVWDAFPVHPFDYLLKPYKEEKFEQLAGELRRVLCRQQPELEVRIARQIVRLPLTKIYYATAQNHYVRVVTDDGECRATANFAQVQEQLQTQPEFLVCNRGVIINMSKVLRFEGDCIEMLDGTHLPVRQKDKNSLLAQFTQYQFRGMQREF